MTSSIKELSIIIPCLNEANSLGFCLEKAQNFLNDFDINGEIIVVDNGSTDDSLKIASTYNVRIINEVQKGYGRAIATGMKAADGKYLIMGDADDSYDFYPLMPFIEKLREGHDLVIGNRFKGGIKKGAMPFLHQYLGNPVLSFLGRLFFKIKIGDFLCGLRGLTKDCFNALDLRTIGMEFGPEMIVKAALHKKKMTEIPIILHPDKRNRSSHLKTWTDGWRNLRFLLLYSPKWLFLIPGLILIILGFILSVLLIKAPIDIEGKKLDIHTLVYTCGCIIIGFQFISFYIFSKLYGATHGLLPFQEKFLLKFYTYFKLEKGILIGFLIFLLGVFFSFRSFIYWSNTGFGNLDPMVVLRWVIPSITLIILGIQIILSCFYLSIVSIKNR
jgi:glycosyltransferase involved in cell wall biosynthesis